jgi:hypothetical protein
LEVLLLVLMVCVPQNSANIIVQNRITGQLEEEKMQVYVRLGIRLLYKVWRPGLMLYTLMILKSSAGCQKQDGRRERFVLCTWK